jgi:replicative DNA helicase
MPMTYQGNVSLMIGSIMRELKKIAIRHSLVIFIIAHTEKIRAEDTKPSLAWIRDSSFVVQESDDVIIINRQDFDEDEPICNQNNESSLWILKNRREGLRGKVNLKYVDKLFIEVLPI